jgi:transcriptional regulator with XRE-family HTH domain
MQAQTVSRPSVSGMPGYDDGMHPGGRPPKTPPTQLGQRIAAARERIGLSQVDLAQKLNVTQQTITAWERRSTVIKSDTLIRLASVLNVSVDELLGVAKSRPKPQVARGRLQKVFERAANLPRRQQQKIVELLEPYVREHSGANANGS